MAATAILLKISTRSQYPALKALPNASLFTQSKSWIIVSQYLTWSTPSFPPTFLLHSAHSVGVLLSVLPCASCFCREYLSPYHISPCLTSLRLSLRSSLCDLPWSQFLKLHLLPTWPDLPLHFTLLLMYSLPYPICLASRFSPRLKHWHAKVFVWNS